MYINKNNHNIYKKKKKLKMYELHRNYLNNFIIKYIIRIFLFIFYLYIYIFMSLELLIFQINPKTLVFVFCSSNYFKEVL